MEGSCCGYSHWSMMTGIGVPRWVKESSETKTLRSVKPFTIFLQPVAITSHWKVDISSIHAAGSYLIQMYARQADHHRLCVIEVGDIGTVFKTGSTSGLCTNVS